MKKHALFVALMLVSIASYAQTKGERYVAGGFSANYGNQTTILKEGPLSYTESQPLSTEFGIAAEYGFFAANNLRIAMSVGVSWGSSPITEHDWGWTKNKTFAVAVNPNIAYHMRMTDNLYYTPEIGMSFERGTLNEQTSKTDTSKHPAIGWSAYAHLLAFEFKVSEKIALGAIIGSINYSSATISDDNYYKLRSEIVANQFKLSMNESYIHLRYYY